MGLEKCATSECKFLHEYFQNSQEWMLRNAVNEKNHYRDRKIGVLWEMMRKSLHRSVKPCIENLHKRPKSW